MTVTMGKYHGRQHITKFLCYLGAETLHIGGRLTTLRMAQKRDDEMCSQAEKNDDGEDNGDDVDVEGEGAMRLARQQSLIILSHPLLLS